MPTLSKLRYFKYLTFKRIVNFLINYFSYLLSNILKKPILWGIPPFVSFEPVNFCNLSCPECITGSNKIARDKMEAKFEMFENLIKTNYQKISHILLYFQGEPFLHPKIYDMIALCKKHRIYSASSTNGHFLSPKNCIKIIENGLDELIISIDGADQNIYEKYRKGGNLTLVINGLRNLVEAKKKLNKKNPYIIIQFIVFKHNEHQIEQMNDFYKISGADEIQFKSAQIDVPNKNFDQISSIPQYARYKKDASGNFHIKSKLPNHCLRLWNTMVILNNGDMVACCFDKNGKYRFGNIEQKSIKEIIHSIEFQFFRKFILLNRKKESMCCNCSEGLQQSY